MTACIDVGVGASCNATKTADVFVVHRDALDHAACSAVDDTNAACAELEMHAKNPSPPHRNAPLLKPKATRQLFGIAVGGNARYEADS